MSIEIISRKIFQKAIILGPYTHSALSHMEVQEGENDSTVRVYFGRKDKTITGMTVNKADLITLGKTLENCDGS